MIGDLSIKFTYTTPYSSASPTTTEVAHMAKNKTSDGLLALTPVGKAPAQHKQICAMLVLSRMFSDLEWLEIYNLANCFEIYKAGPGTILFREGDAGTFLCLLFEGLVEISKDDPGGTRKIINQVAPGMTLGEMALIDDEPRSATAIAVQPSTLVVMTQENFTRLSNDKPTLCAKVIRRIARLLSQRLRKTNGVIVDFLEPNDPASAKRGGM